LLYAIQKASDTGIRQNLILVFRNASPSGSEYSMDTEKRASKNRCIADDKPTCRDEFRTCGQNKLNAHLFGEERVDVGFEDQWIVNSSMADRDPTLTVDKNGQRHFSQMAWINKRPMTSITAQVTP
jgi:hypothetical protein